MQVFAETERLILRAIVPSDVDAMFELDSDPAVHKYLGGRPVKTKQQIEKIIEFVRKQYQENGIGRWAVIDKSSDQFIGWTGLKLVKETINNQSNYYDLGYRLIRKYWGKGLATESAIASLNFGFNEMNLKEIIAIAQIENKASNRVIQKLGFEFENSFEYDNASHNWHSLKRENWKSVGI